MPDARRYRAFISYSHADEAGARWLMRRLETYRVPRRLVGTDGAHGRIDARLGAFFRDRDELTASGDLGATIREALAAYADDVRERRFPGEQHTYAMSDEELALFEAAVSEHREHAEDRR